MKKDIATRKVAYQKAYYRLIRIAKGVELTFENKYHFPPFDLNQSKQLLEVEKNKIMTKKEIYILADKFSLENEHLINIRYVIEHKKGKVLTIAKIDTSYQLRNVCNKIGAEKITLHQNAIPLCFEDEILIHDKGNKYFRVSKERLEIANQINEELKAKKIKPKKLLV